MLATIRDYFKRQHVLEVETPVLSIAGNSDPSIESFVTRDTGQLSHYLQTSPELPMKRLLCHGSGSIYQICKVFRQEESGRYHNPEFTMLEWYRVGYDHHQLMDDVESLVRLLFPALETLQRYTYQHLFQQCSGIDPLAATDEELLELASNSNVEIPASCDRDWLLNVLFDLHVGDYLADNGAVFVHGYPASQASLARISSLDVRVAERFELYIHGVELANGFHELNDADQQRARFLKDLEDRKEQYLPLPELDKNFLEALEHGLPDCSGVALGIDRLLMLKTSAQHIRDVIAFPFDLA